MLFSLFCLLPTLTVLVIRIRNGNSELFWSKITCKVVIVFTQQSLLVLLLDIRRWEANMFTRQRYVCIQYLFHLLSYYIVTIYSSRICGLSYIMYLNHILPSMRSPPKQSTPCLLILWANQRWQNATQGKRSQTQQWKQRIPKLQQILEF